MADQLENGQEAIRQTTGLLASMGEKLVAYLPTILIAGVVFLLGMLFARLVDRILRRTVKRSKMDATATGFGRSLVRILMYTLLIIICLSILGVPMASIITVVGAAGVAVGLALQNSLSNLAGGFILLFAKPFQAGDYIMTAGEEGYVESITILYTQLMTRDHRSIYLPNSIVSAGAVRNLSQKGTLKVSVLVSVSYDTNLAEARDVLLEAIAKVKQVLQEPAASVTVNKLADSGVELSMNCWVKKEDYFLAPSLLLEAAKNALDAAGIAIPYPQLDVHSVSAKTVDKVEET